MAHNATGTGIPMSLRFYGRFMIALIFRLQQTNTNKREHTNQGQLYACEANGIIRRLCSKSYHLGDPLPGLSITLSLMFCQKVLFRRCFDFVFTMPPIPACTVLEIMCEKTGRAQTRRMSLLPTHFQLSFPTSRISEQTPQASQTCTHTYTYIHVYIYIYI